jgi:predicted metal-dependent phosphoesterase TrpH
LDCNFPGGIDLHLHSTASDGTLTPSEIIRKAQKLNLRAIAITDHDTVNGSKEALSLGIPPSLKFLTGVEISASPPSAINGIGSFHILGYALRLDDTELIRTLAELQKARKNRNPGIIRRLNDLGFTFSFHDVKAGAGKGQLGRPHIAQFMVKKGYVHSIDEAFDKYLAQGKPAYEKKYRIGSQRAIDVINGAGGIPVLAHPFLLDLKQDEDLEKLVIVLKDMGLRGIEVYYPGHPPEYISHYIELAKKYDLLMTGGTDFHGSLTPDIQMGIGRGEFFVPYALYEKMVSNPKFKSVAPRSQSL